MAADQRVCFILRVRQDRVQEYRERHTVVWSEMTDALRAARRDLPSRLIAPIGPGRAGD